MKILVTGAKGFVGRNLCAQLKNIRDGKAKWYNLPEPVEGRFLRMLLTTNEIV